MSMPPKDPETGRFVKADGTIGQLGADDKGEPQPDKPTPKPPAEPDAVAMEGVNAVAAAFLGLDDKPAKGAPKPEDAGAPPSAAKPPEKKPVAKPAAAAEKPKPIAKAPLTEEQIAAAAAEGATRAMQQQRQQERDTPPRKPDAPAGPDLPPEEQRKIAVLEHMEKSNPDRYKGLTARYRNGLKELADYAAKWETANPGEKFNEEAPEHEAFFSKQNVDWDDGDFDDAKIDLRAEKLLKDREDSENKKLNDRLSDMERKEKLREAAPLIAAEQGNAAKSFWQAVNPDFADMIDEHGQWNVAKWDALKVDQPIAFEHYAVAIQDLRRETEAIYSTMTGLKRYNESDPVHAAMGAYSDRMQRELMKKPVEQRTDEAGRVFAPAARYYAMSESDRDRYWTLSPKDIIYHRARFLAQETRQMIEAEEAKFTRYAKQRGFITDGEDGKGGARAGAAAQPPEPDNTNGKPPSPDGGSESRLSARKGKDPVGDGNPLNSFVAGGFA